MPLTRRDLQSTLPASLLSGVRTIAFKLADQSPEGIAHVLCPAGGGGLCVGVAQRF